MTGNKDHIIKQILMKKSPLPPLFQKGELEKKFFPKRETRKGGFVQRGILFIPLEKVYDSSRREEWILIKKENLGMDVVNKLNNDK